MPIIEKIDTENKSQVKRFVEFYYDLYKDCPQWVPPLSVDAYLPLNRKNILSSSIRGGFLPGHTGRQGSGSHLRRGKQALQ